MGNARPIPRKESPLVRWYFSNGGKGTLTGAGTVKLPKKEDNNGG